MYVYTLLATSAFISFLICDAIQPVSADSLVFSFWKAEYNKKIGGKKECHSKGVRAQPNKVGTGKVYTRMNKK